MKRNLLKASKFLVAVILSILMACSMFTVLAAVPIGSSDQGDGTYKNPVLFSDVPDLDIIRVGDEYWMSSTTMHLNPGVPIMKSTDLVNWETVSYCYPVLADSDKMKLQTGENMYSNGTWASSLRYKDGTFYLVVPSATTGKTYIFQTEDPENQAWRRYELPSRYHDCGLLLDDDGRNWLVYGTNAIELNSTVTGLKEGAAPIKIIDSLHAPLPGETEIPTSGLNEGVHMQKIDGKYYLFAITSPGSGWLRTQVVHVSDSLFGPYKSRTIARENTRVNGSGGSGVAQGGIVDTADGTWYGFAFRDSGAAGRMPWLVPINWLEEDGVNWPMFGGTAENPSHDNIPLEAGIPVLGGDLKSIVSSDEFYNNNPKPTYYDSNITALPAIQDTNRLLRNSSGVLAARSRVGEEQIVNGGFEDGTTGWSYNQTYGDSATIAVTDAEKVTGDYSLHVTNRKSTGSGPMQDLTGKLKAGGTYRVSARIKYDNENGPATRQFYMTMKANTPISTPNNIMKNMRGARITKGEWGTISGEYTLPEDTDESAISIFLETSWTANPTADNDLMDFYVDDVSIIVVSEPEEPGPEDAILNGSFEEELSEENWGDTHETATVTRTTDISTDGEYSAFITDRNRTGSSIRQFVGDRIVVGAKYAVSFDVYYDNENSPDTKQFDFTLNDGGGTAGSNYLTMAQGTATKGQWTTISGEYIIPASVEGNEPFVFFENRPWNGSPGNDPDLHLMDFYIDNVSMIKIADPVQPELEWGDANNYNGSNLNLDWQWNHNPDNRLWSLTEREGWLRLRTGYLATNILDAVNTLTQRTFGPTSSASIAIDVSNMKNGDEAGISLFTAKYGSIGVKMENGKKYVVTTLSNGWSSGHTTNAGVESARVELLQDKVYLKADANYYGQADRGNFYYSLDGITWTKLGEELRMTYSTGNHFMGYRFALYNFAKTTVGGYVDFDYYRISDKITGDAAPTVLDVEMRGAADVAGVAGTQISVPVLLAPLPNGNYTDLSASFTIPADLTVTDVVFGDGVTGEATWEVKDDQLLLTVANGAYDGIGYDKVLFAEIKMNVSKLQAANKTVSIVPDYIIANGDVNVAYDLDGVKADIGLVATASDGAWAKLPGYSNSIITHKYGADPYALEYNGRLYVYLSDDHGSYLNRNVAADESNDYGRLQSLSIVSTADMVNWTDHGTVPINRNLEGAVTTWAGNMFAPAAAHKVIDGEDKFFIYFANSANGIGVLVGDSPVGPFTDPLGKELISRSTPGVAGSQVPWLFDPAVLVDDDGTAYLYFGGGTDGLDSNNPKSARCVQLGDDMISIVGVPQEIDAPGLFEDSGIHKYNGMYYYSYCSNFSTSVVSTATIHYMVSDNPLGPFEYVGPVLPGPGNLGNGDGGNNHHAIFEFDGNWYITYHTRQVNIAERQSQGLSGNKDYRSPSISPIKFEASGKIIPRVMDREGVSQTKTINPFERIEGETIGWNAGVRTALLTTSAESPNMALTELDNGDWVGIGQAAFGETGAKGLSVNAAGLSGGKIEVYIDSLDGEKVGEVIIPAGNGETWETYSASISSITGTHDIFFKYVSTGDSETELFEIDYWSFLEKGPTVETYILGNAYDQDDKVNLKDVLTIQKHVAKLIVLEGKALVAANVDRSDETPDNVTLKDALLLQKWIVKLDIGENQIGMVLEMPY